MKYIKNYFKQLISITLSLSLVIASVPPVRSGEFLAVPGDNELWESLVEKELVLDQKIIKRICDKVLNVFLDKRITSNDLARIPWALDKDCFPTDTDENYRQFADKEIFGVLKELNNRLLKRDFAVNEKLRYVKYPEPIDMLEKDLVDESYSAEALSINKIRKLARDIALFYNAFHPVFEAGEDISVVYLARDALSAYEFHQYCSILSGKKMKATCIYHPGMSPSAIVSDYTLDEGILKVQKATEEVKARVIQRMQGEGLIPDKKGDDFYDVYHHELFLKISNEFTKEMIQLWKKDDSLRLQAEMLYKQMKNNGITGEKNVLLIDLSATGKTVLYIKSVLDYFSVMNGLSAPRVNILLGWSFDRKLCLQELRHALPEFREHHRPFGDQPWPFYRTAHHAEGDVFFNIFESRVRLLQHVFRSLVLYNTSLKFVKRPHKYSVMMFDLDDTLEEDVTLMFKDGKPRYMPQGIIDELLFFAEQGILIALNTSQSFGEVNRFFISRIPNNKRKLLKNIILYTATSAQCWVYNEGKDIFECVYDKYKENMPDIDIEDVARNIQKELEGDSLNLTSKIFIEEQMEKCNDVIIHVRGAQICLSKIPRKMFDIAIAGIQKMIPRNKWELIFGLVHWHTSHILVKGVNKAFGTKHFLEIARERLGRKIQPDEILVVANDFKETGFDREMIVNGADNYSVGTRKKLPEGVNFFGERQEENFMRTERLLKGIMDNIPTSN